MYLTDRGRSPAPDGPSRVGLRAVPSAVLALGTVSLLTDISSESVSAVLPIYLTAALGFGPLAYGLIDGLYQGVSAIVRLAGGLLADRTDRPKWVATGGYALSAITKLVLVVGQGLAPLTAAIALDRIGKGVRTAPRDALVAASSPPGALGTSFGTHRAMDTVGATIGPLLAATILWLVPGDFTSVFVVSTAAAILGLAVLVLLVPDLRPAAAARGGEPTSTNHPRSVPVRLVLAGPMRRVLLAAAVLGMLTISDGFLYLSLHQREAFAAAWFPMLYVGTNLAYFAFAIPFGRLADRAGRARVFVAGHVLLLGAYGCAVLPASAGLSTVAALAFLGAFYAATDGVLAALVSGLLAPAGRTTGIAAAQTVLALARFTSSLAIGLVWTIFGRTCAVLIFAGLLAVAIPAAWALLRDLGAAREETLP